MHKHALLRHRFRIRVHLQATTSRSSQVKADLILKRRESYTGVSMPAQEPTTFDASEGMAVFDDETPFYWVSQTTPENTKPTNVLDKWKLQD